MSSENCRFPIIAIGESRFTSTPSGDTCLEIYWDEKDFSYHPEDQLTPGIRESLDIFDAGGRRFKVLGWTEVKAYRKGFFAWLLRWPRMYDIHHVLELQPQIGINDLRERVVASILSDPDRWVNDELVAGESGEPREPEDLLAERVARVRSAPNFEALIKALESED